MDLVTNTNHVSTADAIAKSRASSSSSSIGATDRGTAIVESNTTLGQNSFLQLLVAQLQNMDPSQDQDSTAYITQMAQFASIEQLNNLNTTMQDFANQQKVGQVAILNEVDSEGYNKWGLITQIYKSGSTTYATIQDTTTGEVKNYDIKNIIGTSDSGYSSSNFETALNSKYLAAQSLASSSSQAVISEKVTQNKTDEKGNIVKETVTKAFSGTITGAYIDKQNSTVMVTVKVTDEDGNETTKDYNYDNIVIAGKLSEDAIKETINKINSGNTSAAAASASQLTEKLRIGEREADGSYVYPGNTLGIKGTDVAKDDTYSELEKEAKQLEKVLNS